MKDMALSDLEDLCVHINAKLSSIKKCILLRDIGEDECCKPSLSLLRKIQNEVIFVNDLLNKMETELKQQEKLKNMLKEMQKAAERDQNEAQHLLEHIPPYLPKPTQIWYVMCGAVNTNGLLSDFREIMQEAEEHLNAGETGPEVPGRMKTPTQRN